MVAHDFHYRRYVCEEVITTPSIADPPSYFRRRAGVVMTSSQIPRTLDNPPSRQPDEVDLKPKRWQNCPCNSINGDLAHTLKNN